MRLGRTWGLVPLMVLLLSFFDTAGGQVTTTSPYGRAGVQWPDYAHQGGTALHTKITNSIAGISDNLVGRWSQHTGIADAATVNITHNFGLAISQLDIRIYESGVLLTQAQRDADYSLATVDTDTISVTNNSGGPKTFDVLLTAFRINEVENGLIVNGALDAQLGGTLDGVYGGTPVWSAGHTWSASVAGPLQNTILNTSTANSTNARHFVRGDNGDIGWFVEAGLDSGGADYIHAGSWLTDTVQLGVSKSTTFDPAISFSSTAINLLKKTNLQTDGAYTDEVYVYGGGLRLLNTTEKEDTAKALYIIADNSGTTGTASVDRSATIQLHNKDATDGNFTTIANLASGGGNNAFLNMVNVSHSSPEGRFDFWTRRGGSFTTSASIGYDFITLSKPVTGTGGFFATGGTNAAGAFTFGSNKTRIGAGTSGLDILNAAGSAIATYGVDGAFNINNPGVATLLSMTNAGALTAGPTITSTPSTLSHRVNGILGLKSETGMGYFRNAANVAQIASTTKSFTRENTEHGFLFVTNTTSGNGGLFFINSSTGVTTIWNTLTNVTVSSTATTIDITTTATVNVKIMFLGNGINGGGEL